MELVEREQLRTDLPDFRVGDTVKVHVKIVEGEKERIQPFEGVIIRKKRGGIRSTFTVRKISYGIGVERIFPIHSPRIDRIDVISRGKVRRAKLFYLRGLKGKAARIRRRKETNGLKPECRGQNAEAVEMNFNFFCFLLSLLPTSIFMLFPSLPPNPWIISRRCTIAGVTIGLPVWMRWEGDL